MMACGLVVGDADLGAVWCTEEGWVGHPACGENQLCARGVCTPCREIEVCDNGLDDDCFGGADNGCGGSAGKDGGVGQKDAANDTANPVDASQGGAAGQANGGAGGTAGAGGGASAVCGDGNQTSPEACDDGFTDACGSCNADCTGPGTASVCGDKQVCPETEKCDDGHTDACGMCNADCTSPGTGSMCGDGNVCPETEACDDGDQSDCGACNASCNGPGVTCGAACAAGPADQTFSNGMIGCKGTVAFGNRATLCGSGLVVCTAQLWVSRHGSAAPSYNYWVNDGPMYYGGDGNNGGPCSASGSYNGGGKCGSYSEPMRVCVADHSDPLGNVCNWANCGWGTNTPNEYFGGCNGNNTAGALCCPP
jgi:hypothetical protein